MNIINMPGFRAEASFYRRSAHYQVNALWADPGQEGNGTIHPAMPALGAACYNTMRGRLCCAWGFGVASCCDLEGSCDSFRI